MHHTPELLLCPRRSPCMGRDVDVSIMQRDVSDVCGIACLQKVLQTLGAREMGTHPTTSLLSLVPSTCHPLTSMFVAVFIVPLF